MIRIGLLLTGLLAFISCGVQLEGERELDVEMLDSSTGDILKLDRQKQPTDCLSSGLIRSKFYNNYAFPVVDFNYPSSVVKTVYLAGTKEIYKSTVGNRSGLGENDYGRVFKPCLGFDYSSFKSYQSAAANALYSFSLIENAKNQQMLPAGISKITLRVGTNVKQIKERSDNGKLIRDVKNLINNAFYSYNSKEVTFVPQGTPHEGISPFSSIAMWEIPFVGTHEYGHHIFSYLVPNYTNDKSIAFHSKHCFDKGSSSFTKSRGRNASVNDSMKALNEGISDLFSRYILDKKVTLKGITCLEKTRDVDSKIFANNRPKKMSQNVFDEFLSAKSPSGSDCNLSVNFHDSHMVGAIIANTFYELLESKDLTKKEKLNFLYDYLKKINIKYHELKSMDAQSAIENMVYMGIEQGNSLIGMSKRNKCRFVATHFPTLHHFYSCK
jgi:hypothetical protein